MFLTCEGGVEAGAYHGEKVDEKWRDGLCEGFEYLQGIYRLKIVYLQGVCLL
jgi:hypothetical protein